MSGGNSRAGSSHQRLAGFFSEGTDSKPLWLCGSYDHNYYTHLILVLQTCRCLKNYQYVCYLFAVALDGLCYLCLPMLQSLPLLVPFSCTFGYFDGAYVTLIPVVTAEIVGTTSLSSALGVVYFLHAVPYLVSPPIAGKFPENTPSRLFSLLYGCENSELTHKMRVGGKLGKREKGLQEPPKHRDLSSTLVLPSSNQVGISASLERQCSKLGPWFHSTLMTRAVGRSGCSGL